MLGLNMNTSPAYVFSAYKFFSEGEKHCVRTCAHDVLLLMLDGVLHFREGGTDVSVQKEHFYIQRRGIFQEGILPSSSARYYYIHFIGEYSTEEPALPLYGKSDFTGLTDSFRQLNFLQASGGSQVEKAAVFYTILAHLMQRISHTPQNYLVRQIIAAVSEQLSHNYSLDELAALCGYSKNRIIQVFKHETGQTPYAYILSLRMDAAKRLLATSEQPIATIAEETGFGSYMNFYKEFIKKQQCTPMEWRKKSKQI